MNFGDRSLELTKKRDYVLGHSANGLAQEIYSLQIKRAETRLRNVYLGSPGTATEANLILHTSTV